MPRERQGSLGGWLFFSKDYDSEPLGGDTGVGREEKKVERNTVKGEEGREEEGKMNSVKVDEWLG